MTDDPYWIYPEYKMSRTGEDLTKEDIALGCDLICRGPA